LRLLRCARNDRGGVGMTKMNGYDKIGAWTNRLRGQGSKCFKLIACEIMYREAMLAASQSKNMIDVEFLRKGLHDAGQDVMRQAIQQVINDTEKDKYEAILLGYGRCNNGIVGVTAGKIPLVVPIAHDCITLFMGSRARYDQYFSESPGTYYRTTGWTERDKYESDSVIHQLGLDRSFDEYVAKYGRENALYIMETMGGWQKNYKSLLYIDMGFPVDDEYAEQARREAEEKHLEFKLMKGDLSLIWRLMEGDWSEGDFLVVQPGETIAGDDDGAIIKARK